LKKLLLAFMGILLFFSTIYAYAVEKNGKFDLQDHLEVGKSYRFHQNYNEIITQALPDQSQSGTITTNTDLVYLYQVIKKDSQGNTFIKVSFESVREPLIN
jgi:hypothetical protein